MYPICPIYLYSAKYISEKINKSSREKEFLKDNQLNGLMNNIKYKKILISS